jgi:hypothetical protein
VKQVPSLFHEQNFASKELSVEARMMKVLETFGRVMVWSEECSRISRKSSREAVPMKVWHCLYSSSRSPKVGTEGEVSIMVSAQVPGA